MARTIGQARWLVLILTGCAGVFGSTGSEPRFGAPAYEPLSADRSPSAPADVAVYTATDPAVHESLPEGIRVGQVGVELAPDFPTADDPHVLLGVIRLHNDGADGDRADARAASVLAATAAEHGANAVLVRRSGMTYVADALYVSTSDPSYPNASSLLSALEIPSGYRRASKVKRALDAFEPITIAARPRTCYALAFALDGDARLPRRAPTGLSLSIATADSLLRGVSIATPLFDSARALVIDVGCTKDRGPLSVTLVPRVPRDDDRLGEGTVVVHVYAQRVSQSEIDAIESRRVDDWRETRRDNCEHCYYLRVRCGEDDVRNCPRYLRCLSKRGESPSTCREHRR